MISEIMKKRRKKNREINNKRNTSGRPYEGIPGGDSLGIFHVGTDEEGVSMGRPAQTPRQGVPHSLATGGMQQSDQVRLGQARSGQEEPVQIRIKGKEIRIKDIDEIPRRNNRRKINVKGHLWEIFGKTDKPTGRFRRRHYM